MLKILIISDERSGHKSISTGFVNYLKKKHNLSFTITHSFIRSNFFKKIATFLLNNITISSRNGLFLIKILYKNFDYKILNNKYDLIISTGGDTSFLNIILSKILNVHNIYFSSLRGLKNTLFSYTVSLLNNNFPNEIVVSFPPIYIQTKNKELKDKYLAVLIGGRTKNHLFKNNDFVILIKNIITLAKKHNYKILLTTSRRTPVEVEQKIQEVYKKNSDIISECVLFNLKPKKIVNFYFSNADAVFCTEDSGSMITEAILSRKILYMIKPDKVHLNKLYRKFLENALDNHYAYSFQISDIKNITFKEKFNFIKRQPAEDVYLEIKKILNPKRSNK